MRVAPRRFTPAARGHTACDGPGTLGIKVGVISLTKDIRRSPSAILTQSNSTSYSNARNVHVRSIHSSPRSDSARRLQLRLRGRNPPRHEQRRRRWTNHGQRPEWVLQPVRRRLR